MNLIDKKNMVGISGTILLVLENGTKDLGDFWINFCMKCIYHICIPPCRRYKVLSRMAYKTVKNKQTLYKKEIRTPGTKLPS